MFSRVLQGWVGPRRAGRAKAGLGGSEAGWAGQGGLGWVRGELGGSEAPAGASGGRNERPPDPGAPGPGTGPSAAAGAAPARRVRQRVGLVLEGGVADHDLVAGLGAGL